VSYDQKIMNSVSSNIFNLLYEYECVVVPGFGGFVTNYRAADIDTSRKVILPPSNDLDFVDKLTFNDGVLVNKLAEQNGRSYQEAISTIETYTSDCTKILYRQSPIYVPQVGQIQANSSGDLQFQAENTNFLTDAFGLPKLDLKPLKSVTQTPPPVKTAPAPVVQSQTKNMAKSSFNLFNILLLATFLFAAYYVWDRYKTNRLNNEIRTETKIPVYDDEEEYDDEITEEEYIDYSDNVTVISSDDEYVNEEPVRTTQEPAPTVRKEPVVQPTKTTTTTRSYNANRYVIVVGSFGNGGNADRMIRECQRQGYETVTSWNGSMKRVGVVVNCSPNQLDGKLRQVQNRFNQNAWIMK